MSRRNYTFIDGTDICPKCGSRMAYFSYKKNAVSNAATKTDWAAMKKITTWTETTYGSGKGCMCLKCYGKRRGVFWAVSAIVAAAVIALAVIGIILPSKPLLLAGIGAAVVLVAFAGSKSGKELYDIGKAFDRYSKPSQEFVTRLVAEHPEQFGAKY